ncbi:class I SAM-dependent methyltransferase [Legionella pneumophila]|uniref:Methyltransferase n=1 Tax=Legionella pneumophila subsp. pascullei TaxID=91890 RepID=A0AAX2ITX4_LEGPN|nr:class I SAM-dependent methyltransferase [Legionella pneumophila]AMP91569.1 methyltransferase [Legionella pneumophila subsp. pascullei]AMP94555.1 methyltransferase [Legionella pneumophila subsp. pascullei]SQG89363.1 Putative Methyltransferase [Legionella pneumophila subsp. pascullei]VEH04562.1 Putative Methyltransferase [Legionella pneumophila subsp. pascullei]HBD7057725.1 class I SAM-dependent methyltransferase [Legionella pneumophila]
MSMYDKSQFFKTYFSNASEKSILVELLEKRFHPPSNGLNILDLGCHDGALMKKIVNAYAERLPEKLVITGVDPSLQAIKEYAKADFPTPVQTNTFAGTAEDYFDSCSNHFDWIIASQCLYWSPDLPKIVKQIHEAGDSSLIVIRGCHGIYEIQLQFRHYIGNHLEKFYTDKDVEMALRSQNMLFQKESLSTTIRLPDKDSIEFKWLILFFLQMEEESLGNKIFSDVQDWITSRTSVSIHHEVHFFWLGNAILTEDCHTNLPVQLKKIS